MCDVAINLTTQSSLAGCAVPQNCRKLREITVYIRLWWPWDSIRDLDSHLISWFASCEIPNRFTNCQNIELPLVSGFRQYHGINFHIVFSIERLILHEFCQFYSPSRTGLVSRLNTWGAYRGDCTFSTLVPTSIDTNYWSYLFNLLHFLFCQSTHAWWR